jgi:hypothetical protein
MIRFLFLMFIVMIVIAGVGFAPTIKNLITLHRSERASEARQRDLHRRMYEAILRPTARWVRRFQASNGRLPSQDELEGFTKSHFDPSTLLIYTNSFQGERRWQNPGVDFVLLMHVSDWNLYYQSWDSKEFKYWSD